MNPLFNPANNKIQQTAAAQQQPAQLADAVNKHLKHMGNSPFIHGAGVSIGQGSSIHSQQQSNMATYFTVNNQTHGLIAGEITKAAIIVNLLQRILRGEATAPPEQLRELRLLYRSLKAIHEPDDQNEQTPSADEDVTDQEMIKMMAFFERLHSGRRRRANPWT